MLKSFLAVFIARNKEYYRDRGAFAWAFVFPLLMIIACAIAFSNPDNSVFTVGVHGSGQASPALLDEPYIKTIAFDDLDKGLQRLQHHQIDLLVSLDNPPTYWINTASTRGPAVEELLLANTGQFTRAETSGRQIRYVDWVIPGVLGMNLMFSALFGVGYVIVRYRHNGVLKRLQVTPVTAVQFLSAQMISRLLIVVVTNGTIFVGCAIFLDLIVLGSYLSLLLITLLGALAMIAISLVIASRTANEELAGGMLNMATWPMLFLSEVWFTLDDAPAWMRAFSELLPLTHIVRAFRQVMVEGATLAEVSPDLLWLMATTVVFMAVAARLFRWHRG